MDAKIRKAKTTRIYNKTVEKVENVSYTYGEITDEKAYSVDINWTYTSEEFADYQKKANLTFIHKDKKLYLVELK